MNTIRKAQKEDTPELAALFNRYRVFYSQQEDIPGAINFIRERMSAGDSHILISCSEKGMLTGFTQLYPLYSSTRMKRLWLLNDLFVLEEHRGKGISKQLIAAATNLAISTNACGLLLETAKTNQIGNQLYPATGFELESGSNFYFWNNQQTKD